MKCFLIRKDVNQCVQRETDLSPATSINKQSEEGQHANQYVAEEVEDSDDVDKDEEEDEDEDDDDEDLEIDADQDSPEIEQNENNNNRDNHLFFRESQVFFGTYDLDPAEEDHEQKEDVGRKKSRQYTISTSEDAHMEDSADKEDVSSVRYEDSANDGKDNQVPLQIT